MTQNTVTGNTTGNGSNGENKWAPTMNDVKLLGRIGRDPEFKTLDGGANVVNFSLCTDEPVSTGPNADDFKLTPMWHRCVAWAKTAEIVRDNVKKGDLVLVEGKLSVREYEDTSFLDQINEAVKRVLSWWNPEGLKEGLIGCLNQFTWTKKVRVVEVKVKRVTRMPRKDGSENAHSTTPSGPPAPPAQDVGAQKSGPGAPPPPPQAETSTGFAPGV